MSASSVHAGLLALHTRRGWRGVLIRGPSGRGKSDLALRLCAQAWRLVADDRVVLWPSGGRLWGRAPDPLRGLLEVRTVGVMSLTPLAFAEVVLVIDCVESRQDLDRWPEPQRLELFGVSLPHLALDPFALSAVEKLRLYYASERL